MNLQYPPPIVIYNHKLFWNPKKGSLYQCLDKKGFMINDEPKALNVYFTYMGDKKYKMKYEDVFIYLGKKERIPELFSFFLILLNSRRVWLIYPEKIYNEEDFPVAPICLT